MRSEAAIVVLVAVTLAGCLDAADPPIEIAEAAEVVTAPLAAWNATLHALPTEAFEPMVAVDSVGTLFVTALERELGTSQQYVLRSQDRGSTWTDVTPRLAGVARPIITFDPVLYLDPHTDRLFLLNLAPGQCQTLDWSDDAGDTWNHVPIACGAPSLLHDHPTMVAGPAGSLGTLGYPNTLHYCVNRVVDTACAFSLDGGTTWSPLIPLVMEGVQAGNGPTDQRICFGATGSLHATHDGKLILGNAGCGWPMVAWTDDAGATWQRWDIADANGRLLTDPAYHDVDLASDGNGTLFATWRGEQGDLQVARAETWDGAWALLGDVQHEDASAILHPSLAWHNGTLLVSYVGIHGDETYHAHLTLVHGDARRHIVLTPPDDPLVRGPCLQSRCIEEDTESPLSNDFAEPESGGIGDFLDAAVGPDGTFWSTFVDICTDSCAEPDGIDNDRAVGLLAETERQAA